MQDNQPLDKQSAPINLSQLHSLQDHVDEFFYATVSLKDWCFQWLRPEQTKRFGYDAQELVSKPFLDFIHPEGVDRVKTLLSNSLRDGIPQNVFRARFCCKDGSYMHLVLSMMHVPEQGLSYIVWGDLSELYNALDRTEQAEKRYRTLFEEAADSMLLVDSKTGEILDFNNAAHNNLGYSRQEFKGLAIADFDVIESPEQVAERIKQIVRDGTISFETKHRRKGGEVRDIYINCRMVDVEGRECILSIFHDITKRKRAEDALHQSRKWLDSIFNGSRDAIFIWNSAGRNHAVNEAACMMTGYSRDELLSMTVMDLGWPENRQEILDYLDRMMIGDALTTDSIVRRKDGKAIQVEWNTRTITVEGKNYIHAVGRDVSWREQKYEKLRGERNRLVAAQEQVRRKVARDLHDGIGQELAALHMGLSGVLSEFTGKFDGLDEQIEPSLEKSIKICQSIISNIRRISRGLYPAQLEAFGLVEALRHLAQQPSRNMKVQVDISKAAQGYEFDEVSAISLYRITQAALLNATSHSKGDNITINLDYNENRVFLTVTDDGIGFDPAEKIGDGMGLMSMKDWAHIAGGSLIIRSKPGQTRIKAVLPTEIVSSDALPGEKQEQ